MGFRDDIAADAAWYGVTSLPAVLLAALRHRTLAPVITLRISKYTENCRPAHLSARLIHRWACQRAGIDLPHELVAGPGLKLTHGWGIVVHPDARIGRNVILMHGVTIGMRSGGVPTIGDDAWIGPNAVVIGPTRVGDRSRVAAGCVLVESIGDDVQVFLDKRALVIRHVGSAPELQE